MAHEHLLPALERFTVLASRLRGLSRFQVSNVALGLSTQEIDDILDTVSCLQLVAHEILIASGQELRQFQAFSMWLRQEIDVQASDVSTLETLEKDPNIDHASTLEYIQGAMTKSRLTCFLDIQAQDSQEPEKNPAAEGRSLFDLYKKELKKKTMGPNSGKRLPALDALIKHLDTQCNAIHARISETQRRNVRLGPPVSLGIGVPHCLDTRMLLEVRDA